MWLTEAIIYYLPRTIMQYPSKPAVTDLPILDAVRERWSPRAIGGDTVEQSKIDTMFEAARWAPSSSNVQPWYFLYATKDDGEAREKLEALLTEGNVWAKNAYILMIIFAKKTMQRTAGILPNPYAEHDTGAASACLALQLPSLGLVGHQMGGFNHEGANEALNVPPEFEPSSMMAIGYPADPSVLSEKHQEQEKASRVRKPQAEFVFRGRWSSY
jgi:nitroreductase